ncbi:MAG: hypothetical protein JXB13_08495 [Phycisphaerae bacterium]|nr:hypothetical protein [Phycisphaerae bacterium]
MKYLRVGLNLLLVAFFALMADGFLHRDPCVQLPDGYSIVAVSGGSPCLLTYEPWNDKRSYSSWKALHSVSFGEEGQESKDYVLINEATGEMLEFDSPLAWDAERRAKNARPWLIDMDEFSGITGFKGRDPFVIGKYDGGYFILNTAENSITSFNNQVEWVQAATEAGMQTDPLVDPKSWLVQARHPVFYVVVAAFVLITLPWVFRPLRSGRRAAAVTSQSDKPTLGGPEPDPP